MSEKVVIIGASGHGKVVTDIIRESGDHVFGFLDDNVGLLQEVAGLPVLGCIRDFIKFPDASFIIAIGNASVRKRIAEQMEGVCWYTAIHPRAAVSTMDVQIGAGSVVMANAVINPCAKIGRHCIINSAAVVEHDNKIEDYAHISVGAKLGGTVSIGKQTWIGIGAIVSNNISICPRCMIGAGTVVIRDIKESGTYVGVPARKIK